MGRKLTPKASPRQPIVQTVSKLFRNFPFLTSLEMSLFSVLPVFLSWVVFLEKVRCRKLQERRLPSRIASQASRTIRGKKTSAATGSAQFTPHCESVGTRLVSGRLVGNRSAPCKGVEFSAGEKSRPGTGSFHPVATEAAAEATKLLKPWL